MIKSSLKSYTVTVDDGSEFEIVAINNAKARQKAKDYLRLVCGFMSQDEMPKFSVKEQKEYTDNSLASAQARDRRREFARKRGR